MEADRGREVASIDWSFAAASQQPYLPPKSPVFSGGASTLPDSSNSFFSNWSGFPHQGGGRRQHHRTPSTSFLPQTPAWIDDLLNDTPDVPPVRSVHRRSSSDSVAFLEVPFQHARIDDIAEEEELDFGNASLKSGRGFKHSDNFEEEQLTSKFAGVGPFQKHRSTYSVAKPDALLSDRRTPSETPSTTSDQESSKAHSLDDQRIRGVGYLKSEPEVQSAHKGEQTLSSTGNTEPLPTSNLNDLSLDPKRAKRILANRQSAQRSRVRKLQYISELERSVNILQEEVSTLSPQVAYLDHHRIILNVDNSAMKQRLAALAQEKLFKDAQNEALKKEVNRLRQVFQQQQQRQMQHHNQQQLATNLSSSQEVQAMEPGISSDVIKCMDGAPKDNGTDVLEVRGPSRSPLLKPIGPSSCLTGEKGKGLLDSQIMSTSTAVHSDLRVHNP